MATNNLHEYLQEIANAIKAKKGSEDSINAQDFAKEISNIESVSPFAVDFGEEIASNNPTFLNALQEDIDYYNEVQRKRAAGEVNDRDLATSDEFREKIVWWPKGMNPEYVSSAYMKIPYKKLKKFVFPECKSNLYYLFEFCPNLEEVEITSTGSDFRQTFENCANLKRFTIHGVPPTNVARMCYGTTNLEEFNMDCSKVTSANYMLHYCKSLKEIDLSFPELTGTLSNFLNGCCIKRIKLDLPNVTSLSGTLRDLVNVEYAYVSIPKVTSNNYGLFYGTMYSPNLTEVYVKGAMVSFSLVDLKNLSMESIKYILDNCQTREDGAAYTLTLYSNVKTAFLAKCDEDAEYAASLIAANEKGLTIA